MTSEDEPPTHLEIWARTAIAASPRFAGSLSMLFEGYKRRWARAEDVLEELESIDAETLRIRFAEREELDVAFAQAMDAAVQSSLRSKRRLLGRALAQATLDDAKIDETLLIVRTLAQIDVPDVKGLDRIYQAELAAREAGEVLPRARYAERESNQRIREAGEACHPQVITVLASLGLIEAPQALGGWPLVTGISEFGEYVLTQLREIDAEPETETPQSD